MVASGAACRKESWSSERPSISWSFGFWGGALPGSAMKTRVAAESSRQTAAMVWALLEEIRNLLTGVPGNRAIPAMNSRTAIDSQGALIAAPRPEVGEKLI